MNSTSTPESFRILNPITSSERSRLFSTLQLRLQIANPVSKTEWQSIMPREALSTGKLRFAKASKNLQPSEQH